MCMWGFGGEALSHRLYLTDGKTEERREMRKAATKHCSREVSTVNSNEQEKHVSFTNNLSITSP